MQVFVHFIMVNKSMRPDVGHGTLLGVTAASDSLGNNHIIHGIHIERSK
jgi:hypothetical protein